MPMLRPQQPKRNVHFFPAATEKAQKAFRELEKKYGQHSAEEASVIVPLGGDGTMLSALRTFHELGKPFYGMNLGTVGFLLNPYNRKRLDERIAGAQSVVLHPLHMTAKSTDGRRLEAVAFNEVTLFRQTRHAARIQISIDGIRPLEEPLVCDGVMLSTPGGSTAYNLSAGGPIIPLDSNILALTPISPFRPRRWRGALLRDGADVVFDVLEPIDRPVRAETDGGFAENVVSVSVRQSRTVSVTLMFDPGHNLEERILQEQFTP